MSTYQTCQTDVAISGTTNLHIRSLLDRQQFSDPDGEAAALNISSATWPLFGLLWPSALRLATWMAARPLVADERILEVGCGLALASLVMHRQGADVVASDCHPLTGEFLAENTRLNDLPDLPYRHGQWGDTNDAAIGTRARVEGRFNLIMGSDVLYERDEDGHLSAFIDQHTLPSAEVLIVDPNRGNRAAFNRRMAAAGFTLTEIDLSEALVDELPYKGRMLRYVREAAH
jgi:predicted nicotinamide N-methyase